MLQQYNEQKGNLLTVYDMLEEKKSDYIDSNLKKEIQQKKDSLLNDQFILAVAGQMKSGKSTLLNALIFGDDILPADDTELTAKITFILYDDKPSFEAVLYTEKEFNDLRNSMKGSNGESEFDNQLNLSLEKLQDSGYSSFEEILSRKAIKGEDFQELIDFVGKNGIYTPFVNTLILKSNSNWLRNIIVVDTPGMNSPNKLRDKIVKDWIVKADAVVYCSYAGRAMDAIDLEFVRNYMLHISPKHRLFALTKSDLIIGEGKLVMAIADMINENWNKKYALIPSKNVVFPVSQMAVLLDKMNKSNAAFSPRMEEEYELLENRISDFNHCHKQFSLLENAIEEKLIANKNSNIIETHQQYLSNVFSEKLQGIKEDLDSCSKSLDLINSDKGELEHKKQLIKSDITKIKNALEEIETAVSNQYDDLSGEIKLKSAFNDAIKRIHRKLDGFTLDELGMKAPVIVEEILSKCIDESRQKSKDFSSKFSGGIQKICNNSSFQLEYLNTELIKNRIQLECNSSLKFKINEIKEELEEESRNLKQNFSESISTWRKFKDLWKRNNKIERERGKDALDKFNEETLKPLSKKFTSIEKKFLSELHTSVSQIFKQIKEESGKILDNKENEIQVLNNTEGKDIELKRQAYKKEFSELMKQQEELESIIGTIETKIKSLELCEAVQ